MKHFSLDPGMTNLRGCFYPRGHIVLMFPTEKDAVHAAELLEADGLSEDEICIATPTEFQTQIRGHGETDEDDDVVLPSVGTEYDTAHHFLELAKSGHYALLVHAKSGLSTEHVRELLKDTPLTYGQRYRFLVIEDVTDEPSHP